MKVADLRAHLVDRADEEDVRFVVEADGDKDYPCESVTLSGDEITLKSKSVTDLETALAAKKDLCDLQTARLENYSRFFGSLLISDLDLELAHTHGDPTSQLRRLVLTSNGGNSKSAVVPGAPELTDLSGSRRAAPSVSAPPQAPPETEGAPAAPPAKAKRARKKDQQASLLPPSPPVVHGAAGTVCGA